MILDVISRKQAKDLGLQRYYTGKPCKHGHICERYFKTGACVVCSQYQNWSEERRQRSREYALRWHQANPYKSKVKITKWRKTNIERQKENCRRWHQENPVQRKALNSIHRALKLQACPVWVDRAEIAEIYANCPEGYHVDHEVPLNHPLVCGLHVPANLQYLPAFDNLSKGNRFDPETYIHTFPNQFTNKIDPRPGVETCTGPLYV